jgi:uridine kinase
MKTKEIDFEKGFFYLIQTINDSEKPVLIAIAGPTCSGKTFLTEMVIKKLKAGRITCSRVGLDDFFKDGHNLPHNNGGLALFDVPDSFYKEEFRKIISDLLLGKDADVPVYDVSSNRRLGLFTQVKAEPIITAEGLFAISFTENLAKNIIRVYVDANEKICLSRNVERNKKRFGCSVDDVEDFFYRRVWPNNVKYVFPQKDKADIILKN